MFHVKHPWGELAAVLAVDLPTEAFPLLDRYLALLRDHAIPNGMVAVSDAERLADRHIGDALRAAPLLAERATIVDLGSGAGLPGVPLAIALPRARVTLCELRRRRAAFLELAVDELGLGERVTVHHGPAAELASGSPFDAAVARAFAGASGTWEAARPLVRPGGIVIYWAGSDSRAGDAPPESDPVEVPPAAALANAGPLVIMTRQ